jgi:hypothetical protein
LIALHKTLLYEHHDFFLASQHPSASLALIRLAAKYSIPARMWRYGIHIFLEVLRHRLPASFEYMLGFIYTVYSMMALLYETVPVFEDTWIECLGDLGRYRMAIDNNIRDRKTWSRVARFWYRKAANKSPNINRFYHYLAILARPYTIQQLSLYTRSLTCVTPFENARGSIITLFNPVLEDSTHHKSSCMKTTFVKAYGLLFTGRSIDKFKQYIDTLLGGILLDYINRTGPRFKEVGVFVIMANSAALFKYRIIKSDNSPKSILRLAFEEGRSHPTESQLSVESLSDEKSKASSEIIKLAVPLVFGVLSTALRKPEDSNIYSIIYTYLVLIRGLADVQKTIPCLEK